MEQNRIEFLAVFALEREGKGRKEAAGEPHYPWWPHVPRRFLSFMREAKTVLDLWWEFTLDELRQKGQDLARSLELQDEAELAEKGHREAFKDQMEEINGQIRMISQHIRRRGMLKPVPCTILFHKPHVGAKQVVREDTGELVKEEAMSPQECQEHLFPPEADQAKTATAE